MLKASSGHPVSFNTTVGGNGLVLLKDKPPPWLKIYNSLSINKRACPLSLKPDLPAIKGFLVPSLVKSMIHMQQIFELYS